ncbi:MarR family winged helix-turn-helix transcriptional regulator [Luteococcus peritonei]|uniref:MarR family winged helix-turn-helix transcriptional regulator n=1 Tax=Luteococcus peritonei TaxID=88874 RepID=A0ABW4RU48_9ACTN
MTPDPTAGLALDAMLTSARLTRYVRRHGHPADTAATWRALAALADQGPLRLGEFAQLDQLSQPTATAKMNRLVAAGLVERRADPSDGRAQLFQLTQAGHERLAGMREQGLACLLPGIEQLDDQERARLSEGLAVLRRVLDGCATPAITAGARPVGSPEPTESTDKETPHP